jgi:hypothetical protein
MRGIMQRPASAAAYAHPRGDHVEVRWRTRPPVQPRSAGRGRSTRHRGPAGKREAVEALLVVVALTTVVLTMWQST